MSAVVDLFGLDDDPLQRDRWGRPLLVPVGGGEKIPYTRASTLGSYIADSTSLDIWGQNQLVIGMGMREDLCHLAASLPPLNDARSHKDRLTPAQKKQDRETKKTLAEIREAAKEAAYGGYKARMGTAVHSVCESPVDWEHVPEALRMAGDAFKRTLDANGITVLASERFVVNDELGAAGSFDHLVSVPKWGPTILDIKTGSVDDGLKFAVQLYCYASADLYDVETDTRTPLASLTKGEEINKRWGLVAHLPIGTGTCELHAVDLEVGRHAALLATRVRAARQVKDVMSSATALWREF